MVEINYLEQIGWIGNFCFLTGGYLLTKKKKFGWVYQILGNLAYFIQALFMNNISLWILSLILIGINIYGLYNWSNAKHIKLRRMNHI